MPFRCQEEAFCREERQSTFSSNTTGNKHDQKHDEHGRVCLHVLKIRLFA
jgi:hypothetical protein